jgi:hypothetical protein
MVRPGFSCQKARKISDIGRRGVIAVAITLGTLGPTAARGGSPATRSLATVAVFSHATRAGPSPISPRPTDRSDARPDPAGEARVVDQLYARLMGECARVLNARE